MIIDRIGRRWRREYLITGGGGSRLSALEEGGGFSIISGPLSKTGGWRVR
jgi:hypothetical protein